MNKTALQQLLNQMREERTKLPLPIEWDRAYQAIEMMIETTYIPMEKEQTIHSYKHGQNNGFMYSDGNGLKIEAEQYYNETYNA